MLKRFEDPQERQKIIKTICCSVIDVLFVVHNRVRKDLRGNSGRLTCALFFGTDHGHIPSCPEAYKELPSIEQLLRRWDIAMSAAEESSTHIVKAYHAIQWQHPPSETEEEVSETEDDVLLATFRLMTAEDCVEAQRTTLRDAIEARLTNSPLDILAGLTSSHNVQRSSQLRVQEHHLEGSLINKKSLVLTVQNPCSETFAHDLMDAFDQLRFMPDPSTTNKSRFVRFASNAKERFFLGKIPLEAAVLTDAEKKVLGLASCLMDDQRLILHSYAVVHSLRSNPSCYYQNDSCLISGGRSLKVGFQRHCDVSTLLADTNGPVTEEEKMERHRLYPAGDYPAEFTRGDMQVVTFRFCTDETAVSTISWYNSMSPSAVAIAAVRMTGKSFVHIQLHNAQHLYHEIMSDSDAFVWVCTLHFKMPFQSTDSIRNK